MVYRLCLMSPETYALYSTTDMTVCGFRRRRKKPMPVAVPGTKLIVYVTQVSSWGGVLEVIDGPFNDETPMFVRLGESDPFSVRYHVRPLSWLPLSHVVPMRDPRLWDSVSFTKGHEASYMGWIGRVRMGLATLEPADGVTIERVLADSSPQDHQDESLARHPSRASAAKTL